MVECTGFWLDFRRAGERHCFGHHFTPSIVGDDKVIGLVEVQDGVLPIMGALGHHLASVPG